MKRNLTLPEAAEELRRSVWAVRQLIKSGQLQASNTCIDPASTKPRYLISSASIEDFLARRATVASPAAAPKRTRTRKSKATPQYV